MDTTDETVAEMNIPLPLDEAIRNTVSFVAFLLGPTENERDILKDAARNDDLPHSKAQAVDRLLSGEDRFTSFDLELYMLENARPGGRLDLAIAALDKISVKFKRNHQLYSGVMHRETRQNVKDTYNGLLTLMEKEKGCAVETKSQLLPRALEYIESVMRRLDEILGPEIKQEVE